MRSFDTGATRNAETGKLDYDGFFSPLVLERVAQYMHKHRHLEDGTLRDSDNWQLGIPRDAYMKSAWRHFVSWWKEHRGIPSQEGLEDALCALIFNAMGYLFETLKDRQEKRIGWDRIEKLPSPKSPEEHMDQAQRQAAGKAMRHPLA